VIGSAASGHSRLLLSRLRNLNKLMFNLIDAPVVVLCYHRVTVMPSDPHLLAVSPDNFRSHMKYLKQNFQVVRFEDDWSRLRRPAFAVTFDDGYADNAHEALPVLEALEIPAVFFISTGNIGATEEFWWDELERLVTGKSNYPVKFELEDPMHGRSWPTATVEERNAMHRDIHRLTMKINAKQRTGWLKQLREWAGQDWAVEAANRSLTEDELKSLAQNQWVTIGAHTVTHSRLSALSEEEQRYEIVSSKQRLEKLLERELNVFSYPFGKRNDYDMTSVRICREAGFLKAAAAFPGEAHRWTDPYQIPRHFVYNWDLDTFAARLKCLWI